MQALLFALTLARAADLQPAVVLPSAAEVPRREGETAWGVAGGYATRIDYWNLGLQGQAVWGVSERLAVTGGIGVSVASLGVWPVVGARYQLYNNPGLHVAPFGVIVGRYRVKPASLFTVTALGIAVEGGWERVRLDASVPLVGYTTGASYPRGSTGLPSPFLLSTLEAGLSVRLSEANTVRAGVLAAMPTLGWRYEAKRWFGEASLSSLGFVGAASVRVGVGL